MKRPITAGLLVVGLSFIPTIASAQFVNPYIMAQTQQNLYWQQMMRAQATNAMYNQAMMSAYTNRAFLPPGPVVDPGFGMTNPYTPTAPGFGVTNPYSPAGVDGYGGLNPYNPYNPYNPFYPPGGGYGFGVGQSLMGSADVMRSYGTVINAQESARILREQALQAKLDTRKKAFELDMYIRANTPTYTQEQERIAKNTLRRIQSNSLPGEVTNGKSLNYLLDDLRKFPNKKIALEPIALSEGVLSHLNVTKNTFGLGILRDDGKVNWPVALQERMSVMQRKELDEKLKDLVKGAYKNQLDANVLKDVRTEMDKIREDLVKRVNETPTSQYMEAKRFLQEFDQASIALEKGEAPVQAQFQRFIEGGKSVQEVADYMVQNGLRFGPATARDEAAYRAAHSGFATYDIAMNSALGVPNNEQ